MNPITFSSRAKILLVAGAISSSTIAGLLPLLVSAQCQAEEELFQGRDVTEVTRFSAEFSETARILLYPEAPHAFRFTPHGSDTCDKQGNLLVLIYRGANAIAIGRRSPAGAFDKLMDLPGSPQIHGLCNSKSGTLYAVNSKTCEIVKIDPQAKEISVVAHDSRMHHLVEMAIAPDGRMFVGDVDLSRKRGSIWKVEPDGKTACVLTHFGLTNALEVSPDGKLLYACEEKQKSLWVFRIGQDGSLTRKRLVTEFPRAELNGLKCDADGNIYVVKGEAKSAYKLSPKGEVLKEIDIFGKGTSLSFGGADGRTVYVLRGGHIVEFRADRPGLAWQRLQK